MYRQRESQIPETSNITRPWLKNQQVETVDPQLTPFRGPKMATRRCQRTPNPQLDGVLLGPERKLGSPQKHVGSPEGPRLGQTVGRHQGMLLNGCQPESPLVDTAYNGQMMSDDV